MDRITYDDVYEIAAEVAEETITKFLQNLVKLVPAAEDVIDDIKDQQYEDLKTLRQSKNNLANFGEQSFVEKQNNDFAAIAGKSNNSLKESASLDAVLSQIPLEKSDLFGAAAASPVDNTEIVAQPGISNT